MPRGEDEAAVALDEKIPGPLTAPVRRG